MRGGKHTIDLKNQRIGGLLVLELSSKRGKFGQYYWKCICDCGKECVINQNSLRKQNTKSCGCLLEEFRKNLLPKITANRNSLEYSEASFNTLYHRYKSRSVKLGCEFSIDKEYFKTLTSQNCHYCGALPERECLSGSKKSYNGYYKYNGLDRVDNGLGYTLTNVVPCCEICNKAKRDMSLEEFESWINRLIKFRLDSST